MRIILLALAVAVVHTVCAQAPVVVLCPYTIAGRVVNFDGIAYEAKDQITLCVRNAAGAVLAKTAVFDPGGLTAWNYRVEVPMASFAVNGYAVEGDALSLSVTDAKGTLYSGFLQGADSLAKPGGTVKLRLMLADDANGNGMADVYEQSKEYDMFIAGIEDAAFDPAKDYDGDGVSNYKEYLAGTDPFDKNDYFHVKAIASLTATDETVTTSDVIALTFEANAGRSYVVDETPSIERGKEEWQRGVFRIDPNSTATAERVTNDKNTWSMRTIYLIKNGPSRFYRLGMEE